MDQRVWMAAVILVLLSGCAGSGGPQAHPPVETSPSAAPTTPPAESTGTESATNWTVTVVEVIDGDTFEVRFANGSTATVRLLGVDTPETHAPPSPDEFEGVPATAAGRDWLTSRGHRATQYAQSQLAGRQIRIAVDPMADRRGYYGRLLVYAYTETNRSFNYVLLSQGYARLYESEFTKRQRFAQAEAEAQSANRGVWGYRTESSTTVAAQLAVATVHADADGNDWENLADEYVVLKNTGATTLDVSGWRLRDDDGHSATLPTGATIAPGGTLTVYTGGGRSAADAVSLGVDKPIWNNGGDVLVVEQPDGTVVLRRSY